MFQDPYCNIICGDSRVILPTLKDKSIDMVMVDPPFGHNNNDGDLIQNLESALGHGPSGEARPIAGDSPQEAEELVKLLFRESARILVPGGVLCCCCSGGGPNTEFAKWTLWMSEYLDFKMMVVWDKGWGLGWHYRRSYEVVLVGVRRGAACKWYDESHSVENIIPRYKIPKIIPSEFQHPTEKPVSLPAYFISVHTLPGDLVLDPFMGGASTLIAAKSLGRRGIGIEIDERWARLGEEKLKTIPWPMLMEHEIPVVVQEKMF